MKGSRTFIHPACILLVGLLSRIWALGLAVTMGMAFALTSCPVLATTGPFDLALPDYLRTVSQLALGTLALMVLLLPSALSAALLPWLIWPVQKLSWLLINLVRYYFLMNHFLGHFFWVNVTFSSHLSHFTL